MSKQKVLVVGVSSYPDPSWALPGVANDAREMARLLSSAKGQFQGGAFTTLTDAQATANAVTAGLNAALGGAQPDETVFVYLAGHGVCRGGQYYFVAHDTDPARLAETGVPLTALKGLFDACRSRSVFVWLDFCHSGGVVERGLGDGSADAAREAIDRELRVVRGHGKVIVAACAGDQTAKESKAVGHGYFTHALVEGLQGKAAGADGLVTAAGLYEYVVKRVEAESHDQCPVLYAQMQGLIVLMHHDPRQIGAGPAGAPPAQKTVCDSSGDWCLLDTNFLHANGVNYNGDGTITAEVEARSPEENAAIRGLTPSHNRTMHDPRQAVAFAHKDDALLAVVSKVEGRSGGGRQSWTVTLKPENVQYGGHGTEVNYQHHSADEIAKMRAGRLLLNAPPPLARRAGRGIDLDVVETAVRGDGKRYRPVDFCLLQEVYAQHKGRPELFLPFARLSALFALRASDCVEQVLELRLGPVDGGKCRVRFRGRRARKYAGTEPYLVELEGDCPLG